MLFAWYELRAVFVLLKLLFQLMLFLSCFEIVSLYETMMKLLKLSFFYLRVYRALIIVSLYELLFLKNDETTLKRCFYRAFRAV